MSANGIRAEVGKETSGQPALWTLAGVSYTFPHALVPTQSHGASQRPGKRASDHGF